MTGSTLKRWLIFTPTLLLGPCIGWANSQTCANTHKKLSNRYILAKARLTRFSDCQVGILLEIKVDIIPPRSRWSKQALLYWNDCNSSAYCGSHDPKSTFIIIQKLSTFLQYLLTQSTSESISLKIWNLKILLGINCGKWFNYITADFLAINAKFW